MVTTNIVVPSLFSLSAKKREKKNEKRVCVLNYCVWYVKKIKFFTESPQQIIFGTAKIVLVLSRLNLKVKYLETNSVAEQLLERRKMAS